MKIECTVDGSIRDYSATGNRPENSLTPVHPPIHLAPTRQQSQTPTVAIIVDTPENCQAVKPTTASVETTAQSKIKEELPRPLETVSLNEEISEDSKTTFQPTLIRNHSNIETGIASEGE